MCCATLTILFTSQAEFFFALPQVIQHYVKPLLAAALWKPQTAIVSWESCKSIYIAHENDNINKLMQTEPLNVHFNGLSSLSVAEEPYKMHS